MRKFIYIVLFVLLTACTPHEESVQDLNGNKISLSSTQGKWVILSYWADWCSGCHKEFSKLNDFYLKHAEQNVLVFGVNYDLLPKAELARVVLKNKIVYPQLVSDPKNIWHLNALGVLPVTFIINPKGKLVKQIIGPFSLKNLPL